ncbi:MAG: DUF3179 domain-containing protein [Gemmatimonadota bacterium]|nr:DUF3179 domain-containing protein [Gemmatimonadota bacterium]
MIGRGDAWKTDFSKISVPPEEIVSGGPPKDGIPAIDEPSFESASEADRWLEDSDPVIVVEHGGEVKAYPLAILIWHEIVNDNVGGQPVAVTYCPLCNTALAFDRSVAGHILDFGTTGRLRHSDLIMYDRQTETWWQQAVGTAIVGELMGTELELVPANTLSWAMAQALYPGILVLSRDTGHRRDYGRNPYVGYDDPGGAPIPTFFRARTDARLPAMDRVVALDVGDGWAVSFSELSDVRVVNDGAGDLAFVVVWKEGASSALDRSQISSGRDVGQTAVFDRRLGNQVLTLEWKEGALRDNETGSTWNLAGRAIAGPLQGDRLRSIPHGNHFWFSWVVFRPETKVWSG